MSRLICSAFVALVSLSGWAQWTLRAPLPDGPRANAVSFVLNDLGYVAGGTHAELGDLLATVWAYDPSSDTWSAKAPLPNGGMSRSVGFSLNGKGYIACGSGDQAEVWRYDPQADTWTPMAGFPGGQRSGAVAFVIGSTAYITSGDSAGTFMTDLWAYDANDDTWEQRTGYSPDFGTREAVGFSLSGKGYVTTGYSAGAWLHCYDPGTDSWSFKASFGGGGRQLAATFVSNGLAYVGSGCNNNWNELFWSWWSYDPVADEWTIRSDGFSLAKSGTVGFAIGNKGYVCGGDALTSSAGVELWEFDTTAPIGVEESRVPAHTLTARFDAALHRVMITSSVPDRVRLMDATGALLSVHRIPQGVSALETRPLMSGLYLIQSESPGCSGAIRLVVAP